MNSAPLTIYISYSLILSQHLVFVNTIRIAFCDFMYFFLKSVLIKRNCTRFQVQLLYVYSLSISSEEITGIYFFFHMIPPASTIRISLLFDIGIDDKSKQLTIFNKSVTQTLSDINPGNWFPLS